MRTRLACFVSLFLMIGACLYFVTGLTGCQGTLAPGGAYSVTDTNGVTAAPDMPLFVADSAYQVAYGILDAAFTTERNNRQLLWSISPKIKHDLDGIRPQANQYNQDYLKARAAYILNPVPSNLNAVQAVLAKIQQIATAAQAALPKGQ